MQSVYSASKNLYHAGDWSVYTRKLLNRILGTICFCMMIAVSPGIVYADGHETVETLKAQIAGMEKKFAAVTKDRDSLYDQLLETIEELESRDSKIQDVSTGRAHILEKFNMQQTDAKAREDELLAEIERLNQGRDFLSDRVEALFAQSKSQSSEALAAQEKLSAEADGLALEAVKQVQSALAERDAARNEVAAATAATARVEKDLQSTINGRDYIEGLLAKEKTSSASKIAEAEAKAKSASNGRALTRNQLIAAKETIARLEEDLVSMKGGAQKPATESASSSSAGGVSAAWANEVSGVFSDAYRGLQGVSVSELPANRVGIRIGNAGLFESGASQLKESGQKLLSRLGAALRKQSDARILVLGHTDNIPVGSSSSYVDNTDLSNRRALAAMQYLGERVGISFDRMSSTGLADNYPIATNDNADGRSKNRRIELELSPLQ